MLKLTRLDHQAVLINPDHVYAVEGAHDTTLKLLGGERILVRETLDEVVALVIEFRKRIGGVPTGAAVVAESVGFVTTRQDGDGGEVR